MYEFLLGDYEDVKNLLRWLSEIETIDSFDTIMESLYKYRDKFRKYFKKIFPNNGKYFDPILCKDLETLKIVGIFEEGDGHLKVNKYLIKTILEHMR